ncbi:hypothetical protein D3C85_1503690 [compost metagenome]
MSEHFLNRSQISTMIQQMCSERMSDRMGRNICLYPSLTPILLDRLPESLPGESSTQPIGEQRFLFLLNQDGSRFIQIL